jgi:GntR family transcriptional regulator
LFITLSPSSPEPMYKQITDQIRDAIAAGDLAANERLPSVRELAEALKTSAITIKRAFLDLENEGCIITRAGLGTFVSEVDRGRLRERKLEEFRVELTRILKTGAKFNIGSDDLVRLIHSIKEE